MDKTVPHTQANGIKKNIQQCKMPMGGLSKITAGKQTGRLNNGHRNSTC